jgi:heme/copper-type cytochrome/quinol oxidase subunit 3
MAASTLTDTIAIPPEGAAPTMRFVPPPPIARRPGRPRGYWGLVSLIATEATLFIGLLATYFFLRASSNQWPQGGIKPPDLTTISIFSVILVASSGPVIVAEIAIKRGGVRAMRTGLVVAFLMGAAFLAHEGYEWAHLEFNWTRNAYTSIFYATTGLHAIHVLIGLLVNLQVQVKSWMGKIDRDHHMSMDVFGLYWHFVDGVWIFVFGSLYLSAHIR